MLNRLPQSGEAAVVIEGVMTRKGARLGTCVSVIGRLAMNRLEQLSSAEFCANLWPQLCAESDTAGLAVPFCLS